MKTLEYRTIEKSTWADGPWHHEPDKRQWLDEASGLPCLVLRNELTGTLNGYAAVPPEHPAHGLHYDGTTTPEAEARRKAWRKEVRDWARAGKPPLEQWWMRKDRPPDLPDDPFPGVGELLAAVAVHGGLTFAGPGTPPTREAWQACCKSVRRAKAEAKKHPQGDWARYRWHWLPVIEDYDAWAAKVWHTLINLETEPTEPTDWWFFGFDTGHAWDLSPAMEAIFEELGAQHMIPKRGLETVYRELAYVEAQVLSLASQLKAMAIAATEKLAQKRE